MMDISHQGRVVGKVLGVQIDVLSWSAALDRLLGWARARQSRYVAISNVHVVVSASRDAAYRQVIDGADMATQDGVPCCCGMLSSLKSLGSR